MKLHAPALILALTIGIVAHGQDGYIELSGSVTDRTSREPIAGATIRTVDGEYYTISNGDGDYVLKLPESLKKSSVIFRSLGYAADTLTVKHLRRKPNVAMQPRAIELKAVEVGEYSSPKLLVEAALRNIPQNYSVDTTIGTFFYRDCRTLNDEVYLFDEMVFEALRVGYDKHHNIKKFKNKYNERTIASNYKAILYDRLMVLDTAWVDSISYGMASAYTSYSDENVLSDDLEAPYASSIFSDLKNYNMTMTKQTDGQSADYYVVTINNKKKKSNVGAGVKANVEMTMKLYIAYGTLAITRIETTETESVSKFPPIVKAFVKKYGLDSISTKYHSDVRYSEIGNRYTLTSDYTRTQFTIYCKPNSLIGQERQCYDIVTQLQLTKQGRGDASFLKTRKIQSPKTISITDRTIGKIEYDDSFWNQYSYVPLEASMRQKLMKRLSMGKQYR